MNTREELKLGPQAIERSWALQLLARLVDGPDPDDPPCTVMGDMVEGAIIVGHIELVGAQPRVVIDAYRWDEVITFARAVWQDRRDYDGDQDSFDLWESMERHEHLLLPF